MGLEKGVALGVLFRPAVIVVFCGGWEQFCPMALGFGVFISSKAGDLAWCVRLSIDCSFEVEQCKGALLLLNCCQPLTWPRGCCTWTLISEGSLQCTSLVLASLPSNAQMFVRFVASWKWLREVIQLKNLHNHQRGGMFLKQAPRIHKNKRILGCILWMEWGSLGNGLPCCLGSAVREGFAWDELCNERDLFLQIFTPGW